MKKLLILVLVLLMYLCIVPIMADDYCMDIQSVDFKVISDQLTPGSDIVHRFTILGSPSYHYSCFFYFDPRLEIQEFSNYEGGLLDYYIINGNVFLVDYLEGSSDYPFSYYITGKISPLYSEPGDIIQSKVVCQAFTGIECSPNIFIDTAYAEFIVQEPSYPIPEFPSSILPVTMIFGLLGSVYLINRTKEH